MGVTWSLDMLRVYISSLTDMFEGVIQTYSPPWCGGETQMTKVAVLIYKKNPFKLWHLFNNFTVSSKAVPVLYFLYLHFSLNIFFFIIISASVIKSDTRVHVWSFFSNSTCLKKCYGKHRRRFWTKECFKKTHFIYQFNYTLNIFNFSPKNITTS